MKLNKGNLDKLADTATTAPAKGGTSTGAGAAGTQGIGGKYSPISLIVKRPRRC